MSHLVRLLGSIRIAVPLLIAIAGVLAWGTIYEARFGTAAVQRVVYASWWFQSLLGFLAVNLAVAALQRYPWQRHRLPFVLAHLGIILILLGGILGGRFGIQGQLTIAEGEVAHTLELPQKVLVVQQANPGIQHIVPTHFEVQAWVHEPRVTFPLRLEDRAIQVTVDRYFPDALVTEEITGDGPAENPAVQLRLRHGEQEETVWLFARDPERFGVEWGSAHIFFLEPATDAQRTHLLGRASAEAPRGLVSLTLPGVERSYDIPVPDVLGQPIPLDGAPYVLTFKDYFADFAVTSAGLISQSDDPNNPAVSFTLSGPEGVDVHLLVARHPEFAAVHGQQFKIPAVVHYLHGAGDQLPPGSIALVREPSGTLSALLTGWAREREHLPSVEVGRRYTHSWSGHEVEVLQYVPRAKIAPQVTNRSDEVRAEALHLIVQEGTQRAEAWIGVGDPAALPLGADPVQVEYRPAQRDLPVTVKLLDFRKIEYPGIAMAAAFESDVELTDPQRGLILLRQISMNNPLRYRGFSFYQSSYIEGPRETTVLSVRSDPGTPFVYLGFLIVIIGVISMFILRSPTATASTA